MFLNKSKRDINCNVLHTHYEEFISNKNQLQEDINEFCFADIAKLVFRIQNV